MGRIKSRLVKRTGIALIKEESRFNDNFENNKPLLNHVMPSKKIKNQVAGYIARVKKREVTKE
jgi:ribosomal protein S17E